MFSVTGLRPGRWRADVLHRMTGRVIESIDDIVLEPGVVARHPRLDPYPLDRYGVLVLISDERGRPITRGDITAVTDAGERMASFKGGVGIVDGLEGTVTVRVAAAGYRTTEKEVRGGIADIVLPSRQLIRTGSR